MLVLAGPGSGKTFTIVKRLQNLILQYGVQPEKILVITFTKAAALEMKERFNKMMGHSLYSVRFGTFHAVFYYILRQSSRSMPKNILSDADKERMLEKIYDMFSRQFPEVSLPPEEEMIKNIGKYKNTGEVFENLSCPDFLEQEYFLWIYHAYNEMLVKEEKLDFDDMAGLCLRLFTEKREVLKFWQEQFTYILIDEFQDINEPQYKAVKLLAGNKQNIFAVGDDDQSIYGFRGASPKIMQSFAGDYPDARQIFLTVNYRSQASIVEAAGKVIAVNEKRVPKQIQSGKHGKEEENSVLLMELESREAEQERVAELLLNRKKQGILFENHAIICRTNFELEEWALLFEKKQIPFWRREKRKSVFEHFLIKDIEAYLRIAMGERKRSLFLRIINKPVRYIGRSFFTQEEVTFTELKNACGQDQAKISSIERLERDCKKLEKMSPFPAICYIRKGIGYDACWKELARGRKDREKEYENLLGFFLRHAKAYHGKEEWLKAVDRHKTEFEQTEQKKKEGVSLLTMHGAKGLEFPCVILPDLNEGAIPSNKNQEMELIEEERRMFYVAMTRAKEELQMYYVNGENERKKPPSRFLLPLRERPDSSRCQNDK